MTSIRFFVKFAVYIKHYLEFIMFKIIISTIALTFLVLACTPKEQEKSEVKTMDLSLNQSNLGFRNMSALDLFSTKRLGEFKLSPDGQWIVYRLSMPAIADNKIYGDLYAMKIDGSETIRLTEDLFSQSNLIFSPDGSQLGFISNFEGSQQLYVMDFPKGTPKKMTSLEQGVANAAWSPDGKYFYFTAEVQIKPTLKEMYPDYDKANVKIYDELPIRHWDEWTDENKSHLFIQQVDGGTPKDLMEGEVYDTPLKPYGGAEEICWGADSKHIAYTCMKVDDFVMSTNSDIYIVNIETGNTVNVSKYNLGYDKVPLYSPDGAYIAYTSMARPGFESDKPRLVVFELVSGAITDISINIDQWVTEFVWANDSKSLYFVATDSGSYNIFNADLNGNISRITNYKEKFGGGLQITPDGKKLITTRETFTKPKDLVSIDIQSGKYTTLTDFNGELYEKINPIAVEERWVTSFDGKKIHCWVIFPPQFDPTKPHPMITYCQGGPQSMLSPNFHYRWNFYLFASQGYVVLATNRRGVPGFGQEWNDAISLDWGGWAMNDLLAATDDISVETYIDYDRRAAIGASAGGYAAFWLAAHHNKRFSAFMSHCGVFNFESMYGSTEELFFSNWEYGGPYWDPKHKPNYDKNSPHNYVSKWDTPILISTGMNDFRVPYTQSLEAFTAAKAQGIPAEILIYPEETHFIQKPQEYLIWSDRVFSFLEKYCKSK